MAFDYNKLPLEELQALKAGNYDAVSLGTLQALMSSHGKPAPRTGPDVSKMTGVEKFGRGVMGGLKDVATGGKQLGAEIGAAVGLVKPETVQRITQEGMADRAQLNLLKQRDTAAKPGSQQDVMGVATPQDRAQASNFSPAGAGEFVGRTLPYVAAGGGAGVARQALMGAAMGATQFVPEGESRGANILSGAATGAAVPATIGAVKGAAKGVQAVRTQGLPLSNKWNKLTTAREINELLKPETPGLGALQEKTKAETNALVNRLGSETSPSLGQQTGSYKVNAKEQQLAASDSAFAAKMREKKDLLRKSALDPLRASLGPQQELPVAQPASITGAAQREAAAMGKKSARTGQRAVWKKVDNYPYEPTVIAPVEDALKKAATEPHMAQDVAVKMYEVYKKTPKTVLGMRKLEQQIGQLMNDGTEAERSVLMEAKKAFETARNTLGDRATAGDIALHEGKIVYPSALRAKLAETEADIAAATPKTDVEAMAKGLRGAGDTSAMKMPGETPKSFEARITKAYEKKFAQPEMTELPNTDQLYGGTVKVYHGSSTEGIEFMNKQGTGVQSFYPSPKTAAQWPNAKHVYETELNVGDLWDYRNPTDAKALAEHLFKTKAKGDSFEEILSSVQKGRPATIERDLNWFRDNYTSFTTNEQGSQAIHQLKGNQKLTPYKPPAIPTTADPKLASLTARRDELTKQLANLQPANDVGKAINEAIDYSRTEVFEKYYRDAVADILRGGNRISGYRVPDKAVPERLFTPGGAEQFAKSLRPEIGPNMTQQAAAEIGKRRAAELSMPHVIETLVTKYTSPSSGVMRIGDAVNWARSNRDTLNRLGLEDSVNELIQGQVAKNVESRLAKLAGSKPDSFGNPKILASQMASIQSDLGPHISKLYGPNRTQVERLDDAVHMMRVIQRNEHVTEAGGSTTAEKLRNKTIRELISHVITVGAVLHGVGWAVNAVKGAAMKLGSIPVKDAERSQSAMLQEVLLNPNGELAKEIYSLAPAEAIKKLDSGLKATIERIIRDRSFAPVQAARSMTTATPVNPEDTTNAD